MHFWGRKQKMGSRNKFSAFPMLHCCTAPAHPPLLQTNPVFGESHLPSQQHCFTDIAVHLQTARIWPLLRATQHGPDPFCSSSFKYPGRSGRTTQDMSFECKTPDCDTSLKPLPSQHLLSLPSTFTKCLQSLYHEPDHSSDPALKPKQNPEVRKSSLSFPSHSSSQDTRWMYR